MTKNKKMKRKEKNKMKEKKTKRSGKQPRFEITLLCLFDIKISWNPDERRLYKM